MRTTTSTSSDPLAQPWLPVLRWISSGVIALALVAMAISLIVVVSQPPQGAPAQRSRLEHDPVAWVPVAALGIATLALGVRVFADRREARIRVLRAQLGVFRLRSVPAGIEYASAGWAGRRASACFHQYARE